MFSTEDWGQWLADKVAEGVISGATKYTLEKIFDEDVDQRTNIYHRILGTGIDQRLMAIWRRYSSRLSRTTPRQEHDWLYYGLRATWKDVMYSTMKRLPGDCVGEFVHLVEQDNEHELIEFLKPHVGDDPDVFFQQAVADWLRYIDRAADASTRREDSSS